MPRYTSNKFIFNAILSVCIIVPFSNDIFISGFVEMKNYFDTANISLVLSVFFFGLAVSQPIYGPLLDRFGRRPVLLMGLWIFTLASAQVMLTHSFILLLIGRFFQALGVCSASVSVYAITRDIHAKEQLVRATSLITAVICVGPAIAPLLGSLINIFFDWRAAFICLFVLGVFFATLIQLFFKETHLNKNMDALVLKNIVWNYLGLVKQQNFLEYCILRGVAYGIFFTYFSLSPLFLMQRMHFGIISYGIILAINGLFMIFTISFIPKIIKAISLEKTIYLGFVIITGGGFVMWLLAVLIFGSFYTFMFPMLVVTIGIGMILPSAGSGAMQLSDKKNAGSAAALINSISFFFGSFATFVFPRIIHHIDEFGLFVAIISTGVLLFKTVKNNLFPYRRPSI